MALYTTELLIEPYLKNDWNDNKEYAYFTSPKDAPVFTELGPAETFEIYTLFSDFTQQIKFITDKLEGLHADYLKISGTIKKAI
jgi:hypothetical protein